MCIASAEGAVAACGSQSSSQHSAHHDGCSQQRIEPLHGFLPQAIGHLLADRVKTSMGSPEVVTPFHASQVSQCFFLTRHPKLTVRISQAPAISIENYLVRFAKYTSSTENSMVRDPAEC